MGVLRVTQAFLPPFREKIGGLFISTTSIGGLLGFTLHPVYQATQFVLEGWSESRSFELGLHPVVIKTIAPGGGTTDCIGRSPDSNSSPGYHEIEDKLFTAAYSMHAASTAGPIADAVYEAATDGKDPVRYIAGEDAKAMYARHLEPGSEAFRKEIRKKIIG